jgi:hypothetical protein
MKRSIQYLMLLLVFLCQALGSDCWAASRKGISFSTDKGKEIYLYRDYYALVIGISNYENWPKLPNAANDAREVAGKLAELGFQVKTILDPTSNELKEALSELVYQTGDMRDRAILLYFAGHGETEQLADDTKMGYIIPRDCPLIKKDPMKFSFCAISMRDIESISMKIKSRHVIMLFDSCFSGSLFNIVRAVPDDISEKAALPVRQYITAGREDEQVPDRSTFKRVFLNGIAGDADLTKDGYVTGSELGMYLADNVVNYTRRAQHPQYGKINNPSLDRGDFVFVPGKSDSTIANAAPTRTPEEKQKTTPATMSVPAMVGSVQKKPQDSSPITQAKVSPIKHSSAPSKHLVSLAAPSFPPTGTRYSYNVQRLGERRTDEYVVLGEGVYDGKKVYQVKLEGKNGLIIYDLKTGNWMRTVLNGNTIGSADPYEDIFRYPLEVGKKYQSDFYYFDFVTSGRARANVEVQTFEEVRVPAGTFMAYQITAVESFLLSTGSYSAGVMGREKKFWYSPDLKIFIKMEDTDRRNSITTKTELVDYSEP